MPHLVNDRHSVGGAVDEVGADGGQFTVADGVGEEVGIGRCAGCVNDIGGVIGNSHTVLALGRHGADDQVCAVHVRVIAKQERAGDGDGFARQPGHVVGDCLGGVVHSRDCEHELGAVGRSAGIHYHNGNVVGAKHVLVGGNLHRAT